MTDGFTYGGTRYGGSTYAASEPINPGQVVWRAKNPADGSVDGDLRDVNPVEAFNRYATSATCYFDNNSGEKHLSYVRGRRVELEVSTDGGSTWTRRFAGMVQDSAPNKRNGIPTAEVSLVGYDHFLRRRKVHATYSSETLSAILQDLIESYTPVNWVAGNVSLASDPSIDLVLQGDTVDDAISQVVSESANEEYGVDKDFEIFVRQQSASTAAPLTADEILDYDIPEKGKRAINRFRLFYGEGGNESSVVLEDRAAQLDLKEKLDAPRRVVISGSDTLPEVSSEDEARRIARQRLDGNSPLRTGTITTFGRFDTEAGDVLAVTTPGGEFDAVQFRVAQIEYEWIKDRTILTVAENVSEGIEDLLVSLSDQMSNVRSRPADASAEFTRHLDFESGIEVSADVDVVVAEPGTGAFVLGVEGSELGVAGDDLGVGADPSSSRTTAETGVATVAGLNRLRDGWQGESVDVLSHLGVGTDGTAASEAASSLGSETARPALASELAVDSTGLRHAAVLAGGGALGDGDALGEAGLFDASTGGEMYAMWWFDGVAVPGSGRMTVTGGLTLANDDGLRGVLTSTGQERARDIWLGETGHEPSTFLYGSGTTSAVESDTSLETQEDSTAIDSTSDREPGVVDVTDRLGAGDTYANDLSEVGYENAAGELLWRLVFESLPKGTGTNFALETTARTHFRNA